LSRNPNAEEIADRVALNPKTDAKKLKLKFHPDKLRLIVYREPTEDDKKLSNVAFQFINSIFSEDTKPKDISNCLEDLNNVRAELNRTKQSNSQDIEEMLKYHFFRARPKKAVGGSATFKSSRYQKKSCENSYY